MSATIEYVRDYQTGIECTSDILLEKYDNNPRERTEVRRKLHQAIKDDSKFLVCCICNQPLKLCGGIGGKNDKGHNRPKLYFKHNHDNSECPIKTSQKLTQKEIDCLRYNGAKESERHKKLKEFIFNQLSKDDRFINIGMEKVVKILNENKSWRKPDVSAEFEAKKLVFEIQLQSTFLNVIVDREEDYKHEKTYIMWFFDNNNMEKFRFSEEDIFYANNSNAFVLTNEIMQQSIEQNRFLFECCYKVPYIENNSIAEEWRSKIISIDDLKFDSEDYKVYYYDFNKEKKQLKQTLLQNKVKQENSINLHSNICKEFSKDKFFTNLELYSDNYQALYDSLEYLYKKYNVEEQNKSEVLKTIFMIYSLKKQKVLSWKLNMIGALNNFFNYHKKYSFLVIDILKKYNLKNWILELDKKETFIKKAKEWKSRDETQDEHKFDELFIELFPELGNNQ